MYCSYTHFRVEKWWAVPLFQWHAFRSVNQVNSTKGLVKMEVWPSDLRNYHTLTTWMEKKDMLAFRNSGAHLKAMKLSSRMGRGYAVGWESSQLPTRQEAKQHLEDKMKKGDLSAWLSA
ncbi:MAG TPA: hypothetical protein DCG19_10670 [Cryomorphaceae bacterium]|nr:hypothetical protein [Owenweeksia sp.]MBF99114.1 hypothetical protein [Owenweeksia sp.]HAD97860.1 hypothetical protein [Cryomorphaceae bacterium]HBF20824.1 hypothetical protein [Cryomorphaceae bacterium]|tara:strand:- start:91 stop:447 length:357 start_codon:yes stop_codon:yes gene_type:complete